MAVLRWDPWGELAAMQRDMNELIGRSVRSEAGRAVGASVPAIDAFRTEDGLVVRMELPGLAPEDVEVSVQDGMLTVRGERKLDTGIPEDAWVRRERPVGAFERGFTLPEGTEADAIRASFELGVLELRIPHPPEQKPRRIQVSGGGSQKAVNVGGEE